MEKIGKIAYRLTLLVNMGWIHNVFHALLLCKCLGEPPQVVQFEDVELEDNLVYEEHPMQIIDRQIKTLKYR